MFIESLNVFKPRRTTSVNFTEKNTQKVHVTLFMRFAALSFEYFLKHRSKLLIYFLKIYTFKYIHESEGLYAYVD